MPAGGGAFVGLRHAADNIALAESLDGVAQGEFDRS